MPIEEETFITLYCIVMRLGNVYVNYYSELLLNSTWFSIRYTIRLNSLVASVGCSFKEQFVTRGFIVLSIASI